MITNTLKYLSLSLLIGFCIPQTTFSQVTIGSLSEPNKGALLDLKQSDDLSTKGLGLPRVSLTSNSSLEPCLSPTEAADADQMLNHIGLLVYNVNEIDGTANLSMKKENLLCKGLHVWNGEKWQPIIPLFDPDNNRWKRMGDLTLQRGPSQSEVTTYTTAYFHGYSRFTKNSNTGVITYNGNSVYVCDQSKLVEIDAGQWMTMNLRTEFQPDNATDKIVYWTMALGDNHRVGHYNHPQNPAGLDAKEVELNGLLYNWGAATNGRDSDLDLDSEFATGNPRVQGICPAGWHLPDIKEWTELIGILRAQYYQFGNSTNWVTSVTSTLHGGASISPEQGGMDWRKVGAKWSAVNTGSKEYYGKAGFFWSSTAGNTERDPKHNGDRNKWNSRGFNASNGVSIFGNSNTISTGISSYRSRILMESVRCKKD